MHDTSTGIPVQGFMNSADVDGFRNVLHWNLREANAIWKLRLWFQGFLTFILQFTCSSVASAYMQHYISIPYS